MTWEKYCTVTMFFYIGFFNIWFFYDFLKLFFMILIFNIKMVDNLVL